MRTLSSTLTAYQKVNNRFPIYKIVLTLAGYPTFTYDRTRIKVIDPHDEQSYSQKAVVYLDNSDKALDAVDLKGYEAVISYGLITSAGEEYSATAPLTVISQKFSSIPGELECELILEGIPNMMVSDKASESYTPDDTDVKSVKTLLIEIITATMTCFSHCRVYEVVFDSEDSLLDTYIPKSSFRIYTGGNRLSAIRRLLDYTACTMIVKADGKIHIFVPVTTGTSYDYEYSLSPGYHTFLVKAYQNRLAIPNYVTVKSYDQDDPKYTGVAVDASRIVIRDYFQMKLASDAQAQAIARAIVDKARIQAEGGYGQVPLNIGAEVLDYVKITDSREGDTRTGNIGYIHRTVNAKKKIWEMTFGFGGWTSYRGLLNDLETYTDAGAAFERLSVKNLYAENIRAENLDIVWIDPDGNIDLSEIGDNLDNLPDGEVYARVKSVHLDAGGLVIDDACIYKAGYDPSTKMPGDADLDDIPNGAVYSRVKSASLTAAGLVLLDQVSVGTVYGLVNKTDISAGHILLSTTTTDSTHRVVTDADKSLWNSKNQTFYQATAPTTGMATGDLWFDTDDGYKAYRYSGSVWVTVQDGEINQLVTDIGNGTITLSSLTTLSGAWYAKAGVKISATNGIVLYGSASAFRTRATEYGTDQCYMDSSGAICAGEGAVKLDINGILIEGNTTLKFKGSASNGSIGMNSSGQMFYSAGAALTHWFTGHVNPTNTDTFDLGNATYRWRELFSYKGNFSSRLKIPVGTNMYG